MLLPRLGLHAPTVPGGTTCLAAHMSTAQVITRVSKPPEAEGAALVLPKWLPPAAQLGSASARPWRGRALCPPRGRHQLCQIGCQSAGPPWQGSGEPTRRVEQPPLGTVRRPSFDLGLAARLGRTSVPAWEISRSLNLFHSGRRLAVRSLCCCKVNS